MAFMFKCLAISFLKHIRLSNLVNVFFFSFLFFFFLLFRAAPAIYGGSQARGRIGATVASLHHSHRNV